MFFNINLYFFISYFLTYYIKKNKFIYFKLKMNLNKLKNKKNIKKNLNK